MNLMRTCSAVLASGLILIVLIAGGYALSSDVEALRSLRWFWMGTQITIIAAAVLLLSALSPSSPGEGPGGGRTVWALCALAALELTVFHAPANPSLPGRAWYPETPALRFLQENTQGTRIAGLGNRIYPNAAAVYGLADLRTSNPLKPFPYVLAVAPVSTSMPNSASSLSFATSSFFTFRPLMTRFAPSFENAVAMPYPMDPADPSLSAANPAPVMMMVLPVK